MTKNPDRAANFVSVLGHVGVGYRRVVPLRHAAPGVLTPLFADPLNAYVEPRITEPDMIASREPAHRSLIRAKWLVFAMLLILGASTTAATLEAVHYHHEVVRLRSRALPVSPAPSPAPIASAVPQPTQSTVDATAAGDLTAPLTSQSYVLDTGRVQTTVYLTTASLQGAVAPQGQIRITARITGATPGIQYRLIGGDCQTSSPHDLTWAQGTADATGAAFLDGVTRTLPKGDQYFLTLNPWPADGSSPQRLTPGMEGDFVLGQANTFVGHVDLVTDNSGGSCYVGP